MMMNDRLKINFLKKKVFYSQFMPAFHVKKQTHHFTFFFFVRMFYNNYFYLFTYK